MLPERVEVSGDVARFLLAERHGRHIRAGQERRSVSHEGGEHIRAIGEMAGDQATVRKPLQ